MIYSPRHRRGRGRRTLDHVSVDHPLRCVLYNVDRDAPDFDAWLAACRPVTAFGT